jgi:hypothetical protein
MDKITMEYIGEDDWSRRCFKRTDKPGKMIFKEVDGVIHTSTLDWGEPECPVKKGLVIEIENTKEVFIRK